MTTAHTMQIGGSVNADKNIKYEYSVTMAGESTPMVHQNYKYTERNGALYSENGDAAPSHEVDALKGVYAQMDFSEHFASFTQNGDVYTAENCSLSLAVSPFDTYIVTSATVTVADGKISSIEFSMMATVGAPTEDDYQTIVGSLAFTFTNYGTTVIA